MDEKLTRPEVDERWHRHLSARLVLSHLAVALVATAATYLVVRWWAPMLFDQSMHASGAGRGQGGGAGQGQGPGAMLRTQVAAAVNRAVLVGGLLGVLAAGALAVVIARRITRGLVAVQRAARAMAAGDYSVELPRPGTTELARLADDVEQLRQRLDETEARRVRLLGEVAHELRTPLTVASGYLEAMEDGVMPATPEQFRQVQDELRRLGRLGDDLSALSRTEEGRLQLNPSLTRVDELVSAVAQRMHPQADDQATTLTTSLEPCSAVVDADRISQVITNLVGNALRATAQSPDGRIELSCRRERDEVVVGVADTGVGLSSEDLDRVFERFYRVSPRKDGGSGIGLTIARGIVLAHGGSLVASSAGLGQGATFTVRLPAS